MREIDKIIIHCSATPNDKDITVNEIRDWHVNGNGWFDIGYHYVIYRNGIIVAGRPVALIGAHCRGENTNSIGICLIGNDVFTEKQFNALKQIYVFLKNIYPELKPYGHRDFNEKKTCPNFEVEDYL